MCHVQKPTSCPLPSNLDLFGESRPPANLPAKAPKKAPFSTLKSNPVSAARLGLSNQSRSQTFLTGSHEQNASCVNSFGSSAGYSYRKPELRLTIKPNCITIGTVFTTPAENTLHKHDDLVRFPDTSSKSFRSNNSGRWLSSQGAKKLQESIHYMVQGSRIKHGRGGGWRLSMITLTLPAAQMHLDKTLNAVALNQILVQLRRWGVKNYSWDREAQKNGSVHWHIAVDTFVDQAKLRKSWNSIMSKLGYLQRYQSKHLAMSESDYLNAYLANYTAKNRKSAFDRCRAAYYKGRKSNWSNPNSTDVRAVRSAKCLARYLAKHAVKISKAQETDVDGRFSLEYRRTTGRKWGRSESLSELMKSKVYRIGTFFQLNDIFERIQSQLGEMAYFFKGDKFKCLFFEPLMNAEISRVLRPVFADCKYSPG